MMNKNSKIWLAGATGFLGSHLSLVLQKADQDVVLTSKSGGEVHGQTVNPIDILDPQAVEMSAYGCSSAFLCAGAVSRDKGDAGLLHRLHVEGTRTALSALKRAGVRRVVVASTSGTVAVSTDPSQIASEDFPSPLEHIAAWPYYRSKYFGEKLALEFNSHDFEVVVVCPSLLLGPGDLRESSTSDVRLFLEKAIVACPAGGIAFVDVRDAAQGMWLAMQKGRAGERYLLSATNMKLTTFFGRLSRISGVRAPRFVMPKNRALSERLFELYDRGLRALGGVPPIDEASAQMGQYFWYCSADKAENELGFSARDPGQTLRDTVFDLLERKVVAPAEMRSPIDPFAP